MSWNRSMFDLYGWREVDCVERDGIIHPAGERDKSIHVFSGLTDHSGEFGTPIVYTEWGRSDPDRAILRDYRWPDNDRKCEHWVPESGEESRVPEEEDD